MQGLLTKRIDLCTLFERIKIRSPYFALEDLTLDENNILSAVIPVQHSLEMEIAPIVAAEAGRHLAILGTCSAGLSNVNSGRHYYLAHKAELKRIESILDNPVSDICMESRQAISSISEQQLQPLNSKHRRANLYTP